MTIEELIEICQPLDVHGHRPRTIGRLTQDSREVREGSVFIAVRGTQVDGHMFIENAISRGARVIICEDIFYSERDDVCVLEVENTRSLVGPLAQSFEGNPAEELAIIGVTGTNGKTTVTSLVYKTLKQLGVQVSMLGTVAKYIRDEELESLLTTSDPVELAADMRRMVEAGSTHLVMEVSSHALDQQRVGGIEFDIAAFTNLSHDHLDYHDSLDDYAAAKKKLFDGLSAEATAVVNGDDPHGSFMLSSCNARKIRFGFAGRTAQEREVRCRLVSNTTEGIELEIDDITISSPLVGRFNAYNVALSFIICRVLGYEDHEIAEALSRVHGAAGRMERVRPTIEIPDAPLVLVDYAHTPDALENVLSTLENLKKKNQQIHLVFGCGGDRDKLKRPRMAEVAEQLADAITVTSDNPRYEDPAAIIDDMVQGFSSSEAYEVIIDRKEAIFNAVSTAGSRDIILIAGKGHETYQEIGDERRAFDDREVAREALNQYSDTGEVH
ncbi:MAG: UDP-N-acetylmuramoyl-L-alanyl-D-glutamate--2,6-diaminopimelate ligase [Balneolaceae bacterium]|nr:UDP-N-acetylmuramoyl-L-alanyl-D-glutamate--2,6-diaminopimelate ligase [Balneolaceae bacterium]